MPADQGKKREALKVYAEALTLQPESAVIRLNMANAHAELGEFELGVQLLEQLL